MNRIRFLIAPIVLLGALASSAGAVPRSVSFAGQLSAEDGPVDGPVTLDFRLLEGDVVLWEETHDGVEVTAGAIAADLGSIDPENNPLDPELFDSDNLQLEVKVDGVAMSPRLQIRSVPYALRAAVAANANSLDGKTASDFAPAAHDHDDRYLLRGAKLTCAGNQKVSGIDGAGNVICADDLDSQTGVAAGGGLIVSSGLLAIANSAINSARIADNSITAADIAANAVGASEIADNSVGSADIADNSITAADIAANAVGASEIAANAVGGSEIADNSVGSADIANGSVANADLGASAVTLSKISGNEVLLFKPAAGCANGGFLTTAATCTTQVCRTSVPILFESCSGGCNSSAPLSCPNTQVGFLLSASTPN